MVPAVEDIGILTPEIQFISNKREQNLLTGLSWEQDPLLKYPGEKMSTEFWYRQAFFTSF